MVAVEGLAVRKRLKKFIDDMYAARSDASHGRSAEPTEADLTNLTWVVGTVIQALIGRKAGLRGKGALAEWLEDERLRGRVDYMQQLGS
jgi:hypothetical protein